MPKYVHHKITNLSAAAKYKRNKMHMIAISELYHFFIIKQTLRNCTSYKGKVGNGWKHAWHVMKNV